MSARPDKARRALTWALGAAWAASAVWLAASAVVLYRRQGGFTRESVGAALVRGRPLFAAAAALTVAALLWGERPGPAEGACAMEPRRPARRLKLWRLIVLIAGLGLLTAGALGGGFLDTLAKAVNICTECIGLG